MCPIIYTPETEKQPVCACDDAPSYVEISWKRRGRHIEFWYSDDSDDQGGYAFKGEKRDEDGEEAHAPAIECENYITA